MGALSGWGHDATLGFTHPKTPAVSCLHRVFRGLDAAAFEAVARWSRQYLAQNAGGRVAIGVDSKASLNSRSPRW